MVLITIVTGAYKPTNITGGPNIAGFNAVDGCEILHQLIGGFSHYWVSSIQGGAGFLPSTV